MDRQFSYWKHPWQKWALLPAALLALAVLCLYIRDLRELQAVGPEIYSPQRLEIILSAQRMQILLHGLIFLGCVWTFLTGILVRSAAAARLSEALLYVVLAVTLGVRAIFSAHLPLPWVPAVLALIFALGATFEFFRWQKEKRAEAD